MDRRALQAEPVVIFCVYGFHIGCQTAIALREAGFDASYMEGGHYAWKAIGGPIRANPYPGRHLPEHDEQRDVVDRLQHAAQDERRCHRAGGEHRAGERRAERRGEAARHGGEARRRRPLGRRHDRHHVGAARRHVHLRERAAHEQQPERDFQRRREAPPRSGRDSPAGA